MGEPRPGLLKEDATKECPPSDVTGFDFRFKAGKHGQIFETEGNFRFVVL
jgi:hypothetical protein